MAVERELKLAAGPSFHLPPFDALPEGVSVEAPEEGRYETIYYDTPDLRLARWGVSLRHRSGEGWTLKLPGEVADGLLARSELEFPGRAGKPPAEALAAVRAYVRDREVAPVARLSTWRRRVRLKDARGPLADVVDDEVTVLDGRRVAARFREVEVELRGDGGQPVLEPVLEQLREAGARPQEDPVPKHVRAIGPRAEAPPEVAPAPVAADATGGDLVRAALATSAAALLRRDPAVRLGGDPEAVHDMRVATRRLRSHLRTFRSLLEPSPELANLAGELGWLADQLGEVRDLEVLADRLRREAGELPDADAAIGRKIAGLLEEQVTPARARLIRALNSERYLDLVERLVVLATSPSLADEGGRPAVDLIRELVHRPWRRLRKAVKALPSVAAAEDSELHRIRILAKRSRYAAEAAAPLAGRPAERFAKAVAALQTLLGEHQDSVVAAGFLRSVGGGTRRSFVAGELHQLERDAQTRARDSFDQTWKAAKSGSLRDWLK